MHFNHGTKLIHARIRHTYIKTTDHPTKSFGKARDVRYIEKRWLFTRFVILNVNTVRIERKKFFQTPMQHLKNQQNAYSMLTQRLQISYLAFKPSQTCVMSNLCFLNPSHSRASCVTLFCVGVIVSTD